jgi:transketolase
LHRTTCLNHHCLILQNIATDLRIDSVRSTTEAGSGHPTTCLSAADIIAALFFAEMRFDPHDPQHPEADRFVPVKGPRRADSVRGLGCRRRVSARRGA